MGVSHPRHPFPGPLCHRDGYPVGTGTPRASAPVPPPHLAGTAGARLSLGGEGLAIPHLPALVVAVCGERGSAQCGGRCQGMMGVPRSPHQAPALTVTDGAALALGVEGVSAEDGAVHGRAGHRAQLRETGRDARGPGVSAHRGGLGKKEKGRGVGWGQPRNAQKRKKLGFSPKKTHLVVPSTALTRQMQLRQGSRTEGKVSLL